MTLQREMWGNCLAAGGDKGRSRIYPSTSTWLERPATSWGEPMLLVLPADRGQEIFSFLKEWPPSAWTPRPASNLSELKRVCSGEMTPSFRRRPWLLAFRLPRAGHLSSPWAIWGIGLGPQSWMSPTAVAGFDASAFLCCLKPRVVSNRSGFEFLPSCWPTVPGRRCRFLCLNVQPSMCLTRPFWNLLTKGWIGLPRLWLWQIARQFHLEGLDLRHSPVRFLALCVYEIRPFALSSKGVQARQRRISKEQQVLYGMGKPRHSWPMKPVF